MLPRPSTRLSTAPGAVASSPRVGRARGRARLAPPALGLAALALALVLAGSGGCSSSGPVTLSPAEIESVCVHMVTCQQQELASSPQSVSDCYEALGMMGMAELGGLGLGEMAGCLRAAGSQCDAILACGNEGRPFAACDEQTFTESCEGTMMVSCSEGVTTYFDCSRLDVLYGTAACQVRDGSPECVGTRTCTETFTKCHGNVLEACMGEEYMMLDCSLTGAVCGRSSMGIDYCLGTGAPCQGEGSSSCRGTTVVRCLGGKEAAFDCAAALGAGYTCALSSVDEEGECTPSGTECALGETPDSCEGTQLVFCRAGFRDSVDCTAYGYAGCTTGEVGAYCE